MRIEKDEGEKESGKWTCLFLEVVLGSGGE